MKRIFYRSLILIFLSIFGFAIYLSTIGIKTDRFNDQISAKIKKIDNQFETDLNKIGHQLIDAGPDTVIIKKGAKGSTLFTSKGTIEMPVYDEIELFDPTGAGDSFAGGLVGYISKHGEESIKEALVHATATASFTVSDFGVAGLTKSSQESFESRCKYIKSKL